MRWVNAAALAELLDFIAHNPHSDFYQKKYAATGVKPSAVPFSALPLLTRGELVDTPLMERTFVPKEEVRFVAFTSGTSAARPLITPFSAVSDYHFEPSLGSGVRRPLIIYPPLNKNFGHTFIQQCEQADFPVSPIFADFQNLANSALIARELACDSLYATPTIAALFIPHARERGILTRFKLLALSSETLTAARRAELEAAYPEAHIANLYASSEIGQFVLFPCARMMEKRQNHFHVLTDALAATELIDGELVVSYGLNRAMPLVRYRTGDHFEEVEEGCGCGLPGPVFAWSHRGAVDRVRINGVEFTIEETDRVFSKLTRIAHPHYQVHFNPSPRSGAAIVVEIADERAARLADTAALAALIEAELLDAWRLSASATMRTALERGLFDSFSVAIVPSLSAPGAKTKRFISHVR